MCLVPCFTQIGTYVAQLAPNLYTVVHAGVGAATGTCSTTSPRDVPHLDIGMFIMAGTPLPAAALLLVVRIELRKPQNGHLPMMHNIELATASNGYTMPGITFLRKPEKLL